MSTTTTPHVPVSPATTDSPATESSQQPQRSIKHPCVLCQKRKVRCDRNYPCANCTKARVECISPSTLPPRRRKKRFPEAELLARLKRYEEHLRRYGADIDAINAEGVGSSTQSGLPALEKTSLHPFDAEKIIEPLRSLSIRKSLKHIRNNMNNSEIWSVSDEFQDAEDALQGSSGDETYENAIIDTYDSIVEDPSASLIFSSSPSAVVSLAHLHPPPVQIFKLWQTFLDNVNPLTKIFHAPTIQLRILEASADLENIPKGLEALMFGIYATAVMSMGHSEWDANFGEMGEARQTALTRYRKAAKLALSRAGLLRSSDMTILQAFVLYLISLLNFTMDPRSLFCLTGIAVRIAQRMGLNFDGTSYGLSPFETELRRRLWWQIMLLDFRVAEMSGAGPNILTHTWSTKVPLNINDSDLFPDMKEEPKPVATASEMIFVLQRIEIAQCLKGLRHTPATMPFKDDAILALGNRLEEVYLKHCDPSIPIHLLSIQMARYSVKKLHMGLRHPSSLSSKMTEEDKEQMIALCVEIVERQITMLRTPSLERYFWHIMTNGPFPAYVYLLCVLRYRTKGPLVDRAWDTLEQSSLLENEAGKKKWDEGIQSKERYKRSNIYLALANLTMKAWGARQAACPELVMPGWVRDLKAVLPEKTTRGGDGQGGRAEGEKKAENSITGVEYARFPSNPPGYAPSSSAFGAPAGSGGGMSGINMGAMEMGGGAPTGGFGEQMGMGSNAGLDMGYDSMAGWEGTAGDQTSGNLTWDLWTDIMRETTVGEEVQNSAGRNVGFSCGDAYVAGMWGQNPGFQ